MTQSDNPYKSPQCSPRRQREYPVGSQSSPARLFIAGVVMLICNHYIHVLTKNPYTDWRVLGPAIPAGGFILAGFIRIMRR